MNENIKFENGIEYRRIRFLFYKVGLLEGKWYNNGISLVTGILSIARLDFRLWGFSHQEVWVPASGNRFQAPRALVDKDEYWGQCFSAASRGGKIGVRLAPANEVLKNPKRWRYIEVKVDAERLSIAIEQANRVMGAGYDWWGIISFLIPIVKQRDKKWFCSELCCWFGYLVRAYKKRYKKVSPLRAAQILVSYGHELKRLAAS